MATTRVLVADDNAVLRGQGVKALERAGFEVVGAGAAEEVLQQLQRFDPQLVILNLFEGLLGSRLLGLLPKVPALRKVRLLAMTPSSGWNLPIPEDIAVLQQPSGPEQLVEGVKNVLTMQGHALVLLPSEGLGATASDVEDVDIDEDVSAADLTGEVLPAGEILAPSSEPLTGEISLPGDSELVVENTAPRAVFPEPATPTPVDLPALHLTGPTAIPEIRRQAAAATSSPPPEMTQEGESVILSGSLGAVPLIDVLSLLSRQRQTGVLVASSEGQRIEIIFQTGRIAQATATGLSELRLGRFVRELDTVSQDEVDQLVAQRQAPRANGQPALLGMRLCEVGYLTSEELRQALSRQTAELVYQVLQLGAGRFGFTRFASLPQAAVDRSQGGALELDVNALLLEGFRRIHDVHLLGDEIADGALYVRADERNTNLERIGLTREEAQVLDLCDGRNAIAEIAREARLAPQQANRILLRLQAVRLIRRRLPAMAA